MASECCEGELVCCRELSGSSISRRVKIFMPCDGVVERVECRQAQEALPLPMSIPIDGA